MGWLFSERNRQPRWLAETAPLLAGVCLLWLGSGEAWAQNFEAPDINQPARQFMDRFVTRSVNVDFIVADVLGKVGRQVRDNIDGNAIDPSQRPPTQDELDAQLDDRLQEQGVSAVSDSILIAPGSIIRSLTIVDLGEGSSIAIGR